MAFRVKAPYVTVELAAPGGGKPTVYGFYQGAILPASANPESVARQVRKGLVEEFEPEVEPVAEPVDETGGEPAAPVKPAPGDLKAAWVDWAVAQRREDVTEETARAAAELMTKNDLIATFGG